MSYDDLEFLDVAIDDGIATVRIDRPAKRNTFTADGHRELTGIYSRLASDDDVNVIVITGAGTTFCGGPDRDLLSDLTAEDGDQVRSRIMQETHRLVHDAIRLDKLVVTAINGPAVGMGLAVALLADIIIVEEHVSLAEGHVLGGLTAGDGGTLLWPSAVGLVKAKRYLLTSDPLTAAEAERLGLISEVVPSGGALARANEYAKRFNEGPQFALRTTKRSLNQWLISSASSVFDTAWALEELSMAMPDAAGAAESLRTTRTGAIAPDPRQTQSS